MPEPCAKEGVLEPIARHDLLRALILSDDALDVESPECLVHGAAATVWRRSTSAAVRRRPPSTITAFRTFFCVDVRLVQSWA